jgi:hypothetical protein
MYVYCIFIYKLMSILETHIYLNYKEEFSNSHNLLAFLIQ